MVITQDKLNKRLEIERYFRSVALQENSKNQKPVDYSTQLINNGKKQLLIVLKESIGDLIYSTALLKSIRENYPQNQWNIYFATAPQYKELFDGNNNIDKTLDYQPFMENEILCTGSGNNKGYFDVFIHLGDRLQNKLNYLTHSNPVLPINNKTISEL